MIIRIDPDSSVPTFEQIHTQVVAMISSSILPVDTRLPTIRQLARDLGIAPGTVARAYQELDRTGVIVTRGRHGTYVAGPVEPTYGRSELQRAAENLALKGHQLGMTADQVADMLRRAFRSVAPSA